MPLEFPGMNDLQKLQRRMKALEDTVEKLNVDLEKNAKATKKAGKAAATASGNIQRLGIAFRTTLAPITAIVGGLTLMTKALNTTGEREANFAVINNGLVGLVDNSSAAADELLRVADSLGKATLFDEEDFTKVFKLFTSFRSIGVDAYERVATAAADMGTKLGTAPQAAALQLAKALEDPAKQVTALARSGTVFTEQQKEQIRVMQESGDLLGAQNIILSEIEKQYGGAAEAAGSAGFAGALDSAGEAWRDFLEVLGQSSESGAVAFLNAISDGLNFIVANFDVIGPAAQALYGVIVEPFKALYEGIQAVIGPVDNFREQFRGTVAIITKLVTDITNNVLRPVFKFIGELIGDILKLLAGLVKGIINYSVAAVKAITGALDIIAKAVAAFINSTPAGILSKLFGIDAGAMAANGIRSFAAGIDVLAASVGDYADELRAAGEAARAVAPGGNGGNGGNPFAGAGPRTNSGGAKGGKGGGGGGGGAKGGGAAKALAEAEKLQQAIDKQVLAAEKLVTAQQRRNELLQVTDVNEKAILESENRLYEIAEKYGELAEKSLSDEERQLLLKAQGLEVENERLALEEKLEQIREGAIGTLDEEIKKLEYKLAGKEEEYKWEKMIADAKARGGDPAEVEAKVSRLRLLTEESAKVDELKSAYEGLAQGIAGEMTSAFQSIIDGSKSAEEAMADMFQGIADKFLDMAMQILQDAIVQQLIKLIPALFGGAPAAGPMPGAFAIGQSFEGGGYTGDGPRAGGLDGKGGYMAMVHPEETVIDHRSPMARYNGGNSPSNGGGPMQINFQTQVINSVEYVTKEQAMEMSQRAADDGAKRGASGGHARSMQTLLNSRSQRAKLGMS